MAKLEKYTASTMVAVLRHNSRGVESRNYKNTDIDPGRTQYNFSISNHPVDATTPLWKDSLSYFKERSNELYKYGRSDVVVMAEWLITLPKEIWDMPAAIRNGEPYPTSSAADVKAFFSAVHDFVSERYGRENILQAVAHFDEGTVEKVYDRWGSEVLDENGSPILQATYGQPHIHIDFIPVMNKGDQYVKRFDYKSGAVTATAETKVKDGYEGKFNANERLNRYELFTFHSDLQRYLEERGIKGNVLNGATRNGNWTVKQLKSGLRSEVERLRENERSRNHRR